MATKIDRKELKKPDEVMGFFTKLAEFVSANVGIFIAGILAILLVALLVSAVKFYLDSRQKVLLNQLAKPYDTYKKLIISGTEKEGEDLYTPEHLKERFGELSSEFERIGKKSSRSTVGKRALLFAADAAMRAGDYQKSSDILQSLLKRAKGAEELSLVRYKYAELLEAKGDFETAAKEFEGVASDKNTPMRELALFSAASCYQKLGRYDNAAKLYEMILNEYPDSTLLREVSDRLIYVRSKLKSASNPQPSNEEE